MAWILVEKRLKTDDTRRAKQAMTATTTTATTTTKQQKSRNGIEWSRLGTVGHDAVH